MKSANETKYWLCLIRDGLEVNHEKASELLKEADEISRVIASIVIKLKRNKESFPVVRERQAEYTPF
ncbi:MAG: four helix bundle protein [Bacteroidetes bacterium]|nr:four helix bundle protein [Bacteroidota bacterium]